ncbi:XRE family transcriptional regulator [Butyricicoccus sp. AM28-25]|jgi:transcriptional regulator with XRE-family HTH domain|nr:helix-turn-helix transcriptional regulator [Butyricicoccus sp. AM28-25]RHT67876.1 XRE family transcriptional regulator [Butyricicoccus sp. AM28-25]
MEFYEELKAARIKAGLTQQQIADEIGITKSTYCGYETAKRNPDPQRIKQLAKVLHISADTLLDTGIEKEKAPAPAKAETGEITREMSIELLKALGLLDQSGNLSDDDLAFLAHIVGLLEWRFGDHS